MTTGIKHDASKPRYSLLPAGTVAQIVQVMEFGARKYAIDNWQRVPDARTRYYDALMRHVSAWWAGERADPETNLHHLAHAGCCVLFLLWMERGEPAVAVAAGNKDCECGEANFVLDWRVSGEQFKHCIKCGKVRQ